MLELIKLQSLANSNHLPHAILLNTNHQQTALAIIKDFSKWLLCNNINKNLNQCQCASCKLFFLEHHPDYYSINLGKNEEIKIEHIRSANQFILSNVYLSNTKILLINHVHNINLQAANAFLKNLEEPNLNFKILILLITNNPKVLPNTILSRLVKINLFNIDNNHLAINQNFEADLLEDLVNVWISGTLNPHQLATKWQTFNKSELVSCLWLIITKLIKYDKKQECLNITEKHPTQKRFLDLSENSSKNNEFLNLSKKISPKVLWLLLDSLNYLNKSIILGNLINWQLFLYNFIMTKFTGENIYVNAIRRS